MFFFALNAFKAYSRSCSINFGVHVMFNIEIVQASVDTSSGISKKSGRGFCYYNQPGILRCAGVPDAEHLDGKEVVVSLDDATPLAVGVYELSYRSFYVDRFGSVRFHLKVEPEALP